MPRPARFTCALVLVAILATGCVVENRTKPGLTVLPDNRSGTRTSTTSGGSKAAAPQLPPGPVASPAPGTSQSARIVVRVDRLATVPYDGQVLPLVSPDGRFIAVEQNEPPTWPTIMALPEAEPPSTTGLAVYDLSQSPPEDNAKAMEYPSPLPTGLMLGRACDHRGFLVESPRPDGSRWIGLVSWVGGTLEWLAQGSTVNAHAVLTTRGDLLYTRRAIDAERSELVLRTAAGESTRTGEGSYLFPICTSEKDIVYAFNLSAAGLEVEAIRIVEDPPGSGTIRLGRTFAQSLIGKPGDAALAYQVSAPVQNALVTGKEHEDLPAVPLIFLHPDRGRMVVYDTQASAFTLLAPKSIAAVRWSEAPGYLCTTMQGLVFSPEPIKGEARRRPDIRLDSTPYVPRATTEKTRPVILFGPTAKDPHTKLWVRSLVVTDQPPP